MSASRFCLIILATVSVAAKAQAQSPDGERLKPKWEALDENHDGQVKLDELDPTQAMAMRRSDADGDGAISLAEYVQFDLDPAGAARAPLPANVRLISDIPYAATDDPRQRLDVYLPKSPTIAGPLPVIAYVHGGGWTTGSKAMARSQIATLVDTGRYAAVSIGYRLAWQSRWPAQIHDVKAAIRWVRASAAEHGFDPKRICALGPSAGGHLVALLGLTGGDPSMEGSLGNHLDQSSSVQCVIDMMGPADLQRSAVAAGNGEPSPIDQLLGGAPAERAQIARHASPVTHVDPHDPPFLLIHGSKDPVVPYQESATLAAGLRAAGAPVLMQTVEEGGHGDFGAAFPAVAERMRLFLERNFYDPAVAVPTDPLKK